MSVAKIIEVTARSGESFEAAIAEGISKAGETVHSIQNAWVKEQQVVVRDGEVAEYQVDLKVTFLLD